jgi:hypothetical protein
MGSNRRAGIIFLKIDGEGMDAKGNFTYNLGKPERETILGADVVHGFSEKVQESYIEGEITDRLTLDLEKLVTADDIEVTLEVANGKTISLREAWYAGKGDVQTEQANIQVKFVGKSAKEVK